MPKYLRPLGDTGMCMKQYVSYPRSFELVVLLIGTAKDLPKCILYPENSFKNKRISSKYKEILYVFFLVWMPATDTLEQIVYASGSITSVNNKADNGYPCLVPLPIEKGEYDDFWY